MQNLLYLQKSVWPTMSRFEAHLGEYLDSFTARRQTRHSILNEVVPFIPFRRLNFGSVNENVVRPILGALFPLKTVEDAHTFAPFLDAFYHVLHHIQPNISLVNECPR